jgi:ribonuclease BN (tRNA processing enzyme)
LLNINGKNILFDSGPGTLQTMIRYGVTYLDIDHIFYTHFHPDHTLDLVSILFACRNSRNPRKEPLTIVGPAGFEDFYKKVIALYGSVIEPQTYSIIFKECSESEIYLDTLKVRSGKTVHTDESVAFRVETRQGEAFVYSGDTGACDGIKELAKGADVLVLECSTPDGMEAKGHLSPSTAGMIAAHARPGRLILSHMFPICDNYPILRQCRARYKGKVLLARDGMRIRF